MENLISSLDRIPTTNFQRYGEGGKRLKNTSDNNKDSKPLISIITVVLNGEKFIEETFESVFNQSFQDFEYIVIDGGSTDKTIDIIKKNENKIDYWVSEKDLGLYDAFNKGLNLAKGKFVGIINSDDIYTKNALEILNSYINKYQDIDFIFGSVKKHWGILHGYKPWKIYYSWGFYSSHSTGFFIKSQAAKKVGYYDLQYKYSSDYDYFFRMIVKHKFKGIGTKKNELFGIFRRGGFSSRVNFLDHFFEEIRIRLNNKQNKFLVLFIFVYKYFKHIKKF